MASIGQRRTLDGAMGTALLARGLDAGSAPEAWLVDRADEITAVHASHAAAGAEILLTCSFNLASRRVSGDVEDLAVRAVAAARAAGAAVQVAGAVGPTGLWNPGAASPRAAEVAALYSRAFGALASAGADLVWAESQYAAAEALAALRCATQTGLPAAITVVFAESGAEPALPDGTRVERLLVDLAERGAAAVGVNCVLPEVAGVRELIRRVAGRVAVPVIAKPSAGLPGHVIAPAAFGALCAGFADAGAAWVGGCCGATAEHVAAAVRAIRDGQPRG